MRLPKKLKSLKTIQIFSLLKEEGAALIVTLLVMLVLVLLGLSLLLQSDTEHAIAMNDQDANEALHYAEAGVQWVKWKVLNDALIAKKTDFSDLLKGPSIADAYDNHLPGLKTYLDTTIHAAADITSLSDDTHSLIVNEDLGFGIGSQNYEVLRLVNGNERVLLHIRIDDNHDEGGATDDSLTDTDLRINAKIVADYPIFVKGDGTIDTTRRGTARRKLLAKFGPSNLSPAIRTGKDLTIESGGSLYVCGECGSVHANGNLDLTASTGSINICQNATASGSAPTTSGTVNVGGENEQEDPIYIPVVNPFDILYVPTPSDFDHFSDGAYRTEMRCRWNGDSTSVNYDPGATKYFALVTRKVSGGHNQVYKAYRQDIAPSGEDANDRWYWRLIEDFDDGNASTHVNTILDDCGRVVSGNVHGFALAADPKPAGVNGNAVDDGSKTRFYSFNPPSNYNTQGGSGCTDANDSTLKSTVPSPDNNFTRRDFNVCGSGSGATTFTSGVCPATGLTGVISNPDMTTIPTLPGASIQAASSAAGTLDTEADFKPANAITKSSAVWSAQGNAIYSPIYGAVIFVYGNLDLKGNLSQFYSSTATGIALPDNTWRANFVAFGWIDNGGSVIYHAISSSRYYSLIAGRDINLSGTIGSNVCPTSGDCEIATGNSANYAGIIMAHEQIDIGGTPGIDGFVVAEDAADCVDALTRNQQPKVHGSPSIHYDCDHPPDPWKALSVKLIGWDEVQQ